MAKKKKAETDLTKTVKTENVHKQGKGILLIALGHPMYSFYAYNLAVGLKFHAPDIPIALVTDGGAKERLSDEEIKIFDHLIPAYPDWYNGIHGLDYLKCKLHLSEATPFEKTLFLDVDMQWTPNKSPHNVFEELNGLRFTIANRGIGSGTRRTEWMDVSEAKKYDVDTVFDISSEFIYFEDADDIFQTAQRLYSENKLQVDSFDIAKPDEPYIAVAMGICGVAPHEVPYTPTYWQPYHFLKFHNLDFIYTHYAISFGGRDNPKPVKDKINILTESYFQRSGIRKKPYQVQDKAKVFKAEKRRQER